MKKSTKTIRRRKKNIRLAADVNHRHADMMKSESDARKQRSHIQILSEMVDNKTIDYKRHMPWLS